MIAASGFNEPADFTSIFLTLQHKPPEQSIAGRTSERGNNPQGGGVHVHSRYETQLQKGHQLCILFIQENVKHSSLSRILCEDVPFLLVFLMLFYIEHVGVT